MTRLTLLTLVLPAFGLSALASSVATVTSGSVFSLDGHSITTPGVSSFPVILGDTVATSQGPAVLFFEDGSTVKLATNSTVKIDGTSASPKLFLLAGSLDYELVAGSKVTITNLDMEHTKLVATPLADGKTITATARSQDITANGDTIGSTRIPLVPGFSASTPAKTAWSNRALYVVPDGTSTGPGPKPPVSNYH
jgi:hypothetical protein